MKIHSSYGGDVAELDPQSPLALVANGAVRPDPGRGGEMESGIVHVANDSRFEAATAPAFLQDFTVGWKDPGGLDTFLDFIAPPVPVPQRRFEFKKGTNLEYFQADTTENQDIRAIGQPFKTIQRTRSSVSAKTLNKGLMIKVDHDDVISDAFREQYAEALMSRLYRTELLRAVTLLSASALVNATVHWKTDGTQENPDNDMRTAILAAGDDAGIVPNRAVYGLGAWAQRQACYEAQNNYGGAYIPAGYTVQQLAAKLLLDAIMVFTPRYQSSVSAKSRILNLEAIAFFAQPGVTQEDPSNLKRFISPTEGGTPFRIYIKEHAKFTEIMVEHYCYTVLCDSQGIQALTIDES